MFRQQTNPSHYPNVFPPGNLAVKDHVIAVLAGLQDDEALKFEPFVFETSDLAPNVFIEMVDRSYWIRARELFERNNLEVEKMVSKPTTLIWRNPLFMGKKNLKPSRRLLDSILKLELDLCEEPTLLGMSAKLMVIARKMEDLATNGVKNV